MTRRSLLFAALYALMFSFLAASPLMAADASPAKLFYAKGLNWRCEINVPAPLDVGLNFDLDGCSPLFTTPCRNITIPAGGARVFGSLFIANSFDGPPIGVINAPTPDASSFLAFSDGITSTAFTAPVVHDSLSSSIDVLRAAVAARTDEQTTCVDLYNSSQTSATAVQITSFDGDGKPAKTKAGDPAPVDVFLVPPQSVAQWCLQDWKNPDGSIRSLGPYFSAGSVRVSFGCGGIGGNVCPGPQETWPLVTKGPSSGATVETLPVHKLTASSSASASVSAATSAAGAQLIRLHGSAPLDLIKLVDRYNADILRARESAR